jgi:hypothetical protein
MIVITSESEFLRLMSLRGCIRTLGVWLFSQKRVLVEKLAQHRHWRLYSRINHYGGPRSQVLMLCWPRAEAALGSFVVV